MTIAGAPPNEALQLPSHRVLQSARGSVWHRTSGSESGTGELHD